MKAPIVGSHAALGSAFAGASGRYWLDVFPRVGREVRRWQLRAQRIPDADLRRMALANLHAERGNLDGAAAFAAFVPRARRGDVVRAQVAFQAIYDYLDSLAEEPNGDPVRNGRQLHRALPIALDPDAKHVDYYAHHARRDDGGYLEELIDTCRRAFLALPSCAAVASSVGRATVRMIAYQGLSHDDSDSSQRELARWAAAQTPPELGLRWWEGAAAAASSLGVFALIAAAAEPALQPQQTAAIEQAYFPWIGALHVLLDSLIDRSEDRDAGRPGLVEHYGSPEEMAVALTLLATRASACARALSQGHRHTMLLTAMTGHYLSAPAASLPDALGATRGVLRAVGGLAAPTMLMLNARRATTRSASIPVASLPSPDRLA
jgi:tetraprenyl-beta-curcumene synthase